MLNPSMKLSRKGLDLIKSFEGLALHAYRDTGNVVTIGYGHTLTAKMGQVITRDEAEKLLLEDVAKAEREVNSVVCVTLTQGQFDALVSFEFNTGGLVLLTAKGRERPSKLLEYLNSGAVEYAAGQFMAWVYDNGRRLEGLVRRRNAERDLFVDGLKDGPKDGPKEGTQ